MAQHTVLPSLHFAHLRLQSVCDIDEKRARFVADKFGSRSCYTDYREMWDREDLDALIIQMHPKPRQTIALDALEAGHHVFMPKPPAMTLAATQELAEAADRSSGILMVNFQRRFSFGVAQAREIMGRSDFGRVSQLLFSFCSGAYDEVRGRGYDGPEHAFLLDFMVHHLDLARFLGGEVKRLSVFHSSCEGRVAVTVALKYADGAVGTLQLNSGRIWWRNYDRIEITGRGQYLIVDGLWSVKHYTEKGNTFTENYSDQRSGELTGDAQSLIEFATAIREDREPRCSIRDAVKTMRLYQAISDAVLEGREGEIDLRRGRWE